METKMKTKKFKLKHPKRKLFRSNDPLLSVLMWGVNHCVKELQHVSVPVMLMPDDFRSYSKVKIDNQSFNKENLPSHFKVKEYCPIVFRNLRERFGIDDMDFVNSLTKSPEPMDNPGKSGSKFYISHDKLYVLKTLTSEEVEEMHHLLKQYHPYIVERHGKTLLPQYLAMYRLTVDNVEHYMVLMRNVFTGHLRVSLKINETRIFLSSRDIKPIGNWSPLGHLGFLGVILGSFLVTKSHHRAREIQILHLVPNIGTFQRP